MFVAFDVVVNGDISAKIVFSSPSNAEGSRPAFSTYNVVCRLVVWNHAWEWIEEEPRAKNQTANISKR